MNEDFRRDDFAGEDAEETVTLPVQNDPEVPQVADGAEQSFEPQEEQIANEESVDISSYSDVVAEAENESEFDVQPAPINEIPAQPDATVYSQQAQQPYVAPVSYGAGVYQAPPVQQNPIRQTPPQPQKGGKGLKVFAIIVTALLLLSIGVCGFVIRNYTANPESQTQFSESNSEPAQSDEELGEGEAPDFVIGETPDSSSAISASSIYEKAKEYNVGIVVYAKNSASTVAGEGTGIVMGTDDGGKYTYIITCAHVISDSGISVRVQTADGTTYDADIVGFDTRTDLGVVKIKAVGLTAAEFGDSTKLKVGDPVYAIGNPGGVEFFGSFTGGYVSAIERPISSEIGYTMNCIQHDAAINPGNSGGMLVNQYGQVVGVNSQKIAATNYEGMGFAIPITDAIPIIKNLIKHGYVPNRPKLGIKYYPVSASSQYSMIAQINGLPAGTLIIDEIDSESSLSGKGVRQYDMIIAVNGKELTSADILLELIDDGKVGDKLTLTIARINKDYSVSKFDVEASLVEDKSVPEQVEQTEFYVDPFGNEGYDFFFGN